MVREDAAQEKAQGDRAVLEGVFGGEDAALQFDRDALPHDGRLVDVHHDREQVGNEAGGAPDPRPQGQGLDDVAGEHGRAGDEDHLCFVPGRLQEGHQQAPGQQPQGDGAFHHAEGRLVVACPAEHKGREHTVVAELGEEIDHGQEQRHVQQHLMVPQPADPVQAALQERLVFGFSPALRFRDPDQEEEDQERHGEGSQVADQDDLHAAEGQQEAAQRRRQDGDGRAGEALQAADAAVMLLRHQQAGRHKGGRDLEGVHEAEQDVDEIQMPDPEGGKGKQHKHRGRSAGGGKIRGEHDALFVPAVRQRAGDKAEEDRRHEGTERQQRDAGSRALPAVDPDDDRIIRHGRAQLGYGL